MSKEFGMEQVISQLAVKILFDDYSGFMIWGGKLFYQRSRNNIDIVYDLDKDWLRIFTLERDI